MLQWAMTLILANIAHTADQRRSPEQPAKNTRTDLSAEARNATGLHSSALPPSDRALPEATGDKAKSDIAQLQGHAQSHAGNSDQAV